MRTSDAVRRHLTRGIHPRWLNAEARLLEPLLRRFEREASSRDWRDDATLCLELARFLGRVVIEERNHLASLRARHTQFVERHGHALSELERRHQILEYAKFLGAGHDQLSRDEKAFRRWFGADAVNDRHTRRHARVERHLAFLLQRLGQVGAEFLSQADRQMPLTAWKQLGLEEVAKPLLVHDGDPRVAAASFRCLATALRALPPEAQEGAASEGTLHYVFRSALEPRQRTWIQCEALSLLTTLSPDSFATALRQRLTQPRGGDDLFVRRRAVLLLGERVQQLPALADLIPALMDDPSPYVRQGLCEALPGACAELVRRWLPALALDDASPQVRAAALLRAPALLAGHTVLGATLAGMVRAALEGEKDTFVQRVAIKVAADTHEKLCDGHPEHALDWRKTLEQALGHLRTAAQTLPVRRWASQAAERIWCDADPAARGLKSRLAALAQATEPGRDIALPRDIAGADPALVGRVLAVLAATDFPLEIRSSPFGRRLGRGFRFGFRWWRLVHEYRTPSPDKRQGHSHVVGRVSDAPLRAPSALMAELAETKVPGEPLFIGEEGGWRPYLPLPDDAISTLHTPGHITRFYTSEGVTELRAPPSWLARRRAEVWLARNFAALARLRNWTENSPGAPTAYIEALRRLGFSARFVPHDNTGDVRADPAVTRFFPSLALLPGGDGWGRLEDYFFSVYQNSLSDLALFTGASLVYFIARHIRSNRRIHFTRQSIPLVIGGWGTRGKSGTERLKAAMINALGYGVVSKTTGCEAMFLYADPYGAMREMFLFRPYDKATIWEQFDVMEHGRKLGADVFLWECMALTPSYVKILQRHWVRDDLSTITNTFPDHEDIQGPAGIDIPQVMTNFIPKNAALATSEEQMAPILRHAARAVDTTVEETGWLEAGLITDDILRRFPYDEHPYNIALVTRLGRELGIEPDFALKEMADRVVPDLGVLKTYPVATIDGRRLSFVNGMSANERFGCLSNWTRMAFDRHDPDAEPGTWISTVVNNRADRVARSRVFASILVNDISADRHFLIGSNLHGLVGYINEAWDKYAQTLTLWRQGEQASERGPRAVLEQHARRHRVPRDTAQVQARLAAMLADAGCDEDALAAARSLWQDTDALAAHLAEIFPQRADEILVQHRANLREFRQYAALKEKLQTQGEAPSAPLDMEFRELARTWFDARIVVVEDFYASGDRVVEIIRQATPPGFLNRVMGIQNIKGTGLDFVYRWQAWDTCHKACARLLSEDPAEAERGLRELSAFQEYGVLCEEHVQRTVDKVRHRGLAQKESFQAGFAMILSNMERAMAEVRGRMRQVRRSGWLSSVMAAVEAFLDAGDAVKRRRMADRIYRDLASERVGIERAVLELQGLNKRQKGGWLLSQLHGIKEHLDRRHTGKK